MKKTIVSLLFSLFCFSAHGVSLDFAFELGEKQQPQLDNLLPNVAKSITFNKDSTKLIAHEMGGSIVEWDIQNRQKRMIRTIREDLWSSYSPRSNYLLVPKADGIAVVNVADSKEIQLVKSNYELKGPYESGYYSPGSRFVVLTKGGNEVELWEFSSISIATRTKTGTNQLTIEQGIRTIKRHDFKTQLPVRNGITISTKNGYLAVAGGTYHDDEGHRTIIEIWDRDYNNLPLPVFNTGEILGVWNLIFSDFERLIAVDTQLNGKSGIRVWERRTGRQLLNKSGFEAYWTRALAFAPNKRNLSADEMSENLRTKGYFEMIYLTSGDEKGNLRIWGIPYHTSKILQTKSVFWITYLTGIQALAFSADGKYLAVALWDTTIQIYRWKINGK